jgi:hypothetical protein
MKEKKRHLFDFPPKFEEGDIVKINNKNVWLNEHPYEQNLAKIYDINGDPHEQGENKKSSENYYRLSPYPNGYNLLVKNWRRNGLIKWSQVKFFESELELENVNEEYFNSFKHEGETVEVYKNPKSTEPEHVIEVRGILDRKGNLYVWEGNLLHKEMSRLLGLNLFDGGNIGLYFHMEDFHNLKINLSMWDIDTALHGDSSFVAQLKYTVQNNNHIKQYMQNKFKVGIEHRMH